jgi:hypothetical protein
VIVVIVFLPRVRAVLFIVCVILGSSAFLWVWFCWTFDSLRNLSLDGLCVVTLTGPSL